MTAYGVADLAEFSARLAELRETLEPPVIAGEYVAYTDGACFGNPSGKGGWAAAFVAPEDWMLYGHLSSTSNNRAEALGVLAALEWIPAGSRLTVHSDSALTVNQLEGRYKIKANAEIWELIKSARADKRLTVKGEWVRGHAGDPMNELADRLSKLGAAGALESVPILAETVSSPPPAPTEVDGLAPRGEWETSFLRSVRDQLRRGRALSPKQRAIVERIRNRG